jgi:hypothetical protein
MRAKAETLLQQADRLLCESWNERMWSDGEPIDPSPTIDQAINGGFSWLEIRCSRCKTPSDVDLAAMKHPPTTFVHDLASRLRCRKCAKAGRRPAATLLQLAWQPRRRSRSPREQDPEVGRLREYVLERPEGLRSHGRRTAAADRQGLAALRGQGIAGPDGDAES